MKIYNRKVPVIALVGVLLMISIASAALMSIFVTHTTTAEVTEALDMPVITSELNMSGGENYFVDMQITNNADVPILTEIETTCDEGILVHYLVDGISSIPLVDFDTKPDLVIPANTVLDVTMHIWTASNIITDTYIIVTDFEVPEDVDLLVLENKDTSWNVVDEDDIDATLIYTTNNGNCLFGFYLDGTLAQLNTEYSLIYYADKPDRFNDWGGNNPGALIATGTTDANNAITMSGDYFIPTLPHFNDANCNMDETDYREAPDFYKNGYGAKLWVVPSSDYDGVNTLIAWNPASYLFETDLISFNADMSMIY